MNITMLYTVILHITQTYMGTINSILSYSAVTDLNYFTFIRPNCTVYSNIVMYISLSKYFSKFVLITAVVR